MTKPWNLDIAAYRWISWGFVLILLSSWHGNSPVSVQGGSDPYPDTLNETTGNQFVSEADYFRMVALYSDGNESLTLNDSVITLSAPPHGYRPGSSTKTNSCQQVRGLPSELRSGRVMKPRGLHRFYQKYTETYGIPVLSSINVPADALRRACYTLRFLLAGHSAVRQAFYRLSGRVAVIGRNEGTNDIPEHSNLPDWWNQRARGLGATPYQPVSSGGEENVLCYKNDRYRAQDIFLHETVHGVHLLGAAYGISGWDRKLRQLYQSAKSRGLWANTYSMSTPEEYFAEGTQSYFNVNSYSARPDGVRGPISTRPKLKTYDPALYAMIKEVYPCDNQYLKRCESTRAKEDSQELLMDCDKNGGGGGGGGGGGRKTCVDKHRWCAYWASTNECQTNPPYMHVNCKKSCKVCSSSSTNQQGPQKAAATCNKQTSILSLCLGSLLVLKVIQALK